jgi:hypothetical protein
MSVRMPSILRLNSSQCVGVSQRIPGAGEIACIELLEQVHVLFVEALVEVADGGIDTIIEAA